MITHPLAARTAVLISAAGRGSRMGGDLPKQWQALSGRTVLDRAIGAFQGFARIVVVVHPDDMGRAIAELGGRVTLVAGRDTRSGSVRAGLETLDGSGLGHVLIHDGARPLVAPPVIDAVLDALAAGAPAAAPALAVTDALWRGAVDRVTGFADREGLHRAQTPQGFRREVLDHLAAIDYGWTESYAQVAAATRSPRAVRAVGTACARNPLPVVVPCHRVVKSDGGIGQYVGGVEAKAALLELESAA